MKVNAYSQTWFELFLETQPYTEQVAFVMRNLPNPPYRKILDLCCGQGRHTRLLAKEGYQMVGLDRDSAALDKARCHSPRSVTYVHRDMRQLEGLPGTFDALLSLWQSFGYFDEGTNRDVLRQISHKLRLEGRLILDIYHREFFARHQGTRQLERGGRTIFATNSMCGDHLTCRLDYGEDWSSETFEWQLYTPGEICRLAAEFDLRCLLACTELDEGKPATAENPRMQFVFERHGSLR
jgi:SAM-dependent methyltransferase